jgi:hypothetical protein
VSNGGEQEINQNKTAVQNQISSKHVKRDIATCPANDETSSCQKNIELCCDNECKKINDYCAGFDNDKALVWIIFSLSLLTDVGQIIIAICYRKVFFYRLTWGKDNEGFSYRNFFYYIERIIDYITCGKLGRWRLRNKNVDILIDTDQISLWLHMFLSLALQFSQRLLDLPYLNMSIFLGNGCNLINARQLTKPIEFYILFFVAEIYGLWAFWYCVYKLKKDIEKAGVDLYAKTKNKTVKRNVEADSKTGSEDNQNSIELLPKFKPRKRNNQIQHKCNLNYFSDDVRNLVFVVTSEIPMLMILEYFYVERPLGSDGFFDNYLIATNNILTIFEIFVLLIWQP